MEGTRPLRGQPYPVFKCGLNVKIKVKTNAVLTLTLNILTAFIRLGRVRPEGAGYPPY
jgi:hypothetical protein